MAEVDTPARLAVGEEWECPCGNTAVRESADHYKLDGLCVLVDAAIFCPDCKGLIPTKALFEHVDLDGKLIAEVMESQLATLPDFKEPAAPRTAHKPAKVKEVEVDSLEALMGD